MKFVRMAADASFTMYKRVQWEVVYRKVDRNFSEETGNTEVNIERK